MSVLIIAEKPSVAGSIAAALGATKRQDGYFEGNGYFVSYAFGHLYSLCDTKDYKPDMEGWNLNDYPFIPSEFKYKPIDNPGVKKQIKTIKELASKVDTIINSCDGDREGELIFAELKNDLKFNKPIKRLWITSHTPKDIQKGMDNLKNSLVDLENAGYCRQKIDWIIGINLTVVYTLKAGGSTLKLGRVVLPTLKLIFDREVAIANFKSTPFYMLKSEFKASNESYIGTYFNQEGNTRIIDKLQLINIQESIKNKPGTITKKEGKKTSENAPKLFNLTDLQGHITNKYKGFTSDKVLEIMQSLYEKKHLTYPRTASRYLDDTQTKDAQESLYAVMEIPELSIKDKADLKFHTDKRVFDSSKVDSHPAIIPTYVVPDLSSLSDGEKIVYLEVVKRFVSLFLPAAVYDTVEIITKVENYEFITRGKVLVEEGWKQLYITQADQEEDPEGKGQEENPEESITAKNIKIGDTVLTGNTEIKEGKTNPPAHYTEKTLLTAMETCGKDVENEDELLKGYTIGTPATRGDTIKKLFECGYINQKGKSILITDLGTKVIHFFPVKRLLKTDFTGQIEKTLKDIENGQYDSEEFMNKMTAYIVKNIEEMKSSQIPTIKRPANVIGPCPKCGKNVIETEKAYSCEATRNKECNFTLWKDDKFFKTFSKKLTETIAKELTNKGKVTIKGMKSPNKEGVTFDAIVTIQENQETGFWNYKLDFDNSQKGKGQSKKATHKTIKFKRMS
jgi:DNA topoisomerase III